MELMEHLLSRRISAQRSSPIRDLLHLTEQDGMLSMAGGLPAPATFPRVLLAAAFDRAMAHTGPTGPIALQYAPTEGVAALREQIAADNGMPIQQVVVTTGSQQSLDLLARVLCDPGDTVLVEHPCYMGALSAFGLAGADVIGVPGDADGLDTEALADTLARLPRPPKAVYVVGNFHNPTGTTLPAARREVLLSLAERHGFLIIEDDPYAALRFAGTAPDPLGALGRPVVRLGSASKILAPGLRVGWMSGPLPIVAAAVRAKQAVDLHTSSLNQLMVAEARADATAFAVHLDAARQHYAAQADALSTALRAHVPDARFERPSGGMFVWADLGVPATPLLADALAAGVAFVPGDALAARGVAGASITDVSHHARLSFATLSPFELDEACRRLATARQPSIPLAS